MRFPLRIRHKRANIPTLKWHSGMMWRVLDRGLRSVSSGQTLPINLSGHRRIWANRKRFGGIARCSLSDRKKFLCNQSQDYFEQSHAVLTNHRKFSTIVGWGSSPLLNQMLLHWLKNLSSHTWQPNTVYANPPTHRR